MDITSSYTQDGETTHRILLSADNARLMVRLNRYSWDRDVWAYESHDDDHDSEDDWVRATENMTLAECLAAAYQFFGVTL